MPASLCGWWIRGRSSQARERRRSSASPWRPAGSSTPITGVETLPDLESYLGSLRYLYKAAYTSRITQSGTHTLSMQVTVAGQEAVSPEQTFDVTVEPPSAMLLSPPLQIVRQTDPEDQYNLETLAPASQLLDILLEFPDDHPRDLVRTTLLVDGAPVAENTAEPFDTILLGPDSLPGQCHAPAGRGDRGLAWPEAHQPARAC